MWYSGDRGRGEKPYARLDADAVAIHAATKLAERRTPIMPAGDVGRLCRWMMSQMRPTASDGIVVDFAKQPFRRGSSKAELGSSRRTGDEVHGCFCCLVRIISRAIIRKVDRGSVLGGRAHGGIRFEECGILTLRIDTIQSHDNR